MSRVIEDLVYRVGADVKGLGPETERARGMLRNMTRSANEADGAVSKVQARFSKMIGTAAAGWVSIGAAKEMIRMADSAKLLESRLKLVTSSSEELARVQSQLFRIAQNSKQGIGEVTDLYTRMARSGQELGLTQAELLQMTENVGNALTVSGTTSEQAAGALMQFGQALGAGTVRAEEFNSILEGSPRIAQAVAQNWGEAGVSVAKLRALVNSGKVSSEEFARAFLRASEQLKAEAATMPETVAGNITKLTNSITVMVSQFDEAAGLTGSLSAALADLAKETEGSESKATAAGKAWRKFAGEARGVFTMLRGLSGLTSGDDGQFRQGLKDLKLGVERWQNASETPSSTAVDYKTTRGLTKADFEQPKAVLETIDPQSAKKSADALADVRKEMEALIAGFENIGPVTKFRSEMDEFRRNAIAAKVPAKELAADMDLLNVILRQVQRAASEEAGAELDALMASMTTTAVDDMNVALAAQVRELRLKADANVDALDGDKELAERQYAVADALEAQGKELATVTGALEDLQKAKIELEDNPANANLSLAAEQKKLENIRAQLKDKKAIEIIDAAIRDLNKEQHQSGNRSRIIAESIEEEMIRVAGTTETAARAAYGLATAFGAAGSNAGKAFAQVMAIAGGVRQLATLSKEKGGLGNALKSSEGLLAAIPIIGGLLNGLKSVGVKAYQLGTKSTPEQKAMQEMQRRNTEAIVALTKRIGDLASLNVSANQFFGAQRAIDALLSAKYDVRGGTDRAVMQMLPKNPKIDGSAYYASEGLTTKDIEAIAAELGVAFDGTVRSLVNLRAALQKVDFSVLTRSIPGLQNLFGLLTKFDREGGNNVRGLEDTREILSRLGSPEMRNTLSQFDTRTEEGRQAMRDFLHQLILQLTAGIPEAFAQLGDLNMGDFLTLTGTIVDQIDAITAGIAQGVDTLAPALKRLEERTTLFGLSAQEVLAGTLAAYGNAFPRIAGLLTGLELGTEEGTAAAKKRLQDFYELLNLDGVDASEQPLVDALLAISGALDDAGNDVLTIAEQIAQRGKEISEKFDRGITAQSQFDKFNTPYGATRSAFQSLAGTMAAGINAGANVGPAGGYLAPTKDGLLTYRAQIRDEFNRLAAGGIDEGEAAIVEILSGILDGIDAAITQFEDEAKAPGEALRNAVLQRVSDVGMLDRALGTDASQSLVNLASAFGVFGGVLDDLGDVSPAAIDETRDALQSLLRQVIEGSLPLEKLGALTRDEYTNAILTMLNGITSITDSFEDAASRLTESTRELEEEMQQMQFDIIDARGGDSRLARFDDQTNDQRAAYEAAGKGEEYLKTFDQLRQLQRANLLRTMAEEVANAQSAPLETASEAERNATFTGKNLGGASEVHVVRLTDISLQQLSTQRQILNTLNGPLPALRTPALPANGTFQTINNNPNYNFTFNVTLQDGSKRKVVGPESTRWDLQEFARVVTPYISTELARALSMQRAGGLT
ncbi:MAG: tape measure protein [Gemmatimonas sp.]